MRSATRTDDRNEFSIPLALLCCRAFCRRTPFGPCALMETPGGEGVLVTEEATWEQFATWPATPARSASAVPSASAPPPIRAARERAALTAGTSPAGLGQNVSNQNSPPGSHATCPKSSRVAADPSEPNRAATLGFPNDLTWTASSPGLAGNAKQTVTAQKSDDDHCHPAEREQASITNPVLCPM